MEGGECGDCEDRIKPPFIVPPTPAHMTCGGCGSDGLAVIMQLLLCMSSVVIIEDEETTLFDADKPFDILSCGIMSLSNDDDDDDDDEDICETNC